jgi:aspartokinase-like uncharacterized kinase
MPGMATAPPIHVAKLGGSLLDLDDLPAQFARWCESDFHGHRVLVIGGGRPADAVRDVDQRFGLDEEAAHWLAIEAMQLNAHMFAIVLPNVSLAVMPGACRRIWDAGQVALVDPLSWLAHEHAAGVTIPHRWSFTSDSVAAHIAMQLQAAKLTLLKSTLRADITTRQQASDAGLVDGDFPSASAHVQVVELLNLRDTQHTRIVLQA